MTSPPPEVRQELERMLEKDQTRLGEVYRLTQQGLDASAIATNLGVRTAGFVSNYRSTARAILDAKLPASDGMQSQIASSIRSKLRDDDLSEDARVYLRALLDRLGKASPASASPRHTLRQQVDQELRRRTQTLVDQIRDATGIDADDYFAVVSAGFSLDAISRLIMSQSTSRTTKHLASVGRLDLSVEEAVAKWAGDLPLGIDLVEFARGRVAYWRST